MEATGFELALKLYSRFAIAWWRHEGRATSGFFSRCRVSVSLTNTVVRENDYVYPKAHTGSDTLRTGSRRSSKGHGDATFRTVVNLA